VVKSEWSWGWPAAAQERPWMTAICQVCIPGSRMNASQAGVHLVEAVIDDPIGHGVVIAANNAGTSAPEG